MSLFILRFWPAILPLAAYIVWYILSRREALRKGGNMPNFRDGSLFWTIVACLVIGIFIFLLLGIGNSSNQGEYIPPRFEEGKIIPGHLEKYENLEKSGNLEK